VVGFKNRTSEETTRLGSNYGGYYIPNEILESKKAKTLISCGLGFDISFDIEMIKFGFNVLGIEPVLESIVYVQDEIRALKLENFYNLIPKAVSRKNGLHEFEPPLQARSYHWWADQSNSEIPLEKVILPCISLESILKRVDKFSQITVAKFDIEGSEIEVIESILENDFQFDWLIIEIDYLNLIKTLDIRKRIQRAFRVRKIMRALKSKGYEFQFNEEFNFFWRGHA
jgi:FkbM family methyltransferase